MGNPSGMIACKVEGATRSPQCSTASAPSDFASAAAEARRVRRSWESETMQIFIGYAEI